VRGFVLKVGAIKAPELNPVAHRRKEKWNHCKADPDTPTQDLSPEQNILSGTLMRSVPVKTFDLNERRRINKVRVIMNSKAHV